MINFKSIVNHILCRIIEYITYDILHRRVSGRITIYEATIEIHHNNTIVLFLKEKENIFETFAFLLQKIFFTYTYD